MTVSSVKVVRTDIEDGEILTKDELAKVRRLLAIMEEKEVGFDRLKQVLDDQPDLHEIAEGKKASIWLWKQTGALAKWIGIVIGALVTWKAYIASGGVKP